MRVFSDTGCIHILAISGLHVGLAAVTDCAVFYVRFLGCPYRMSCYDRRYQRVLHYDHYAVYAGPTTGAALPVMRATLLLWVACAGVWTKRRMA